MKASIYSSLKPIEIDNPILLIMGDGRSLPQDLDEFLSWRISHDAGCIGRSVRYYEGRVKHWFNGDGETAIWWARKLKEEHGDGLITHTLGHIDEFDADWEIDQPDYHNTEVTNEGGRLHGSSAIFAVSAGLAMGYQRIILAGCPLDTNGHWYYGQELYETQPQEVYGPIWLGYDFMAWLDFTNQENSKQVRSMSGYTKKILGEATKQWLTS